LKIGVAFNPITAPSAADRVEHSGVPNKTKSRLVPAPSNGLKKAHTPNSFDPKKSWVAGADGESHPGAFAEIRRGASRSDHIQ